MFERLAGIFFFKSTRQRNEILEINLEQAVQERARERERERERASDREMLRMTCLQRQQYADVC